MEAVVTDYLVGAQVSSKSAGALPAEPAVDPDVEGRLKYHSPVRGPEKASLEDSDSTSEAAIAVEQGSVVAVAPAAAAAVESAVAVAPAAAVESAVAVAPVAAAEYAVAEAPAAAVEYAVAEAPEVCAAVSATVASSAVAGP